MSTKPPIIVPDSTARYEEQYHLPELEGSERQVAWARIIRHKWLQEAFRDMLDHLTADVVNAIAECRADTSAATWIDRRTYEPLSYLTDSREDWFIPS